MLTPFGADIWIADGPDIVAVAGFRYPTRMAVVRLESGDLVLWSPVALTEELRSAIDALGKVRHFVAPNDLHHLSVAEWQAAYPEASLHAAPGLQEKRTDLKIGSVLGDDPDPAWDGEIEQVVIPGNRITTEVVLFHRGSGTVLFVDLLQQMSPDWYHGWRAVVAKLDLMTERVPTVPRKFRLAFNDRKAAREAIDRMLDWPTQKVLMAHGTPVEADARAFLFEAFRWLKV